MMNMHPKNVVRGKNRDVSVVETTTEQFREAIDDCFDAVSRGQPHIVHRNQLADVAVISIQDYAKLQEYKRLLSQAARELLQESS